VCTCNRQAAPTMQCGVVLGVVLVWSPVCVLCITSAICVLRLGSVRYHADLCQCPRAYVAHILPSMFCSRPMYKPLVCYSQPLDKRFPVSTSTSAVLPSTLSASGRSIGAEDLQPIPKRRHFLESDASHCSKSCCAQAKSV
jgi:hypothetical protein